MNVQNNIPSNRHVSPVEWSGFQQIESQLENHAQENGENFIGYEEAMQGVPSVTHKQQPQMVWWLQRTLEQLGLINAYRKHFLSLHPAFAQLKDESLANHGNVIEHCNAASWAIAKPE